MQASNKKMNDDMTLFDNILNDIQSMKDNLTRLSSDVKQMKKRFARRKVSNIKSGFVKPVKLSYDLQHLIGSEDNELVSRSVVNKKINDYIKANNLQVPENRQTFVLDDKLSNLFGLDKGTVVHYFKMQTYLKNHYPKDTMIAVM
jgi:chromatin remodeling complex protein RSC6